MRFESDIRYGHIFINVLLAYFLCLLCFIFLIFSRLAIVLIVDVCV